MMSLEEAAQVVAHMIAIWPHANIPEDTALIWIDRIRRYDLGTCGRVVARLERETPEFFPSLGLFGETYEAMRPRQPSEFFAGGHRPAVVAGERDLTVGHEHLADMRTRVSEIRLRLAQKEPLSPVEKAGLNRVARERADGTLDVALLERMLNDFHGGQR